MTSRPFRVDATAKSQAANSFAESSREVDSLLGIHERLTGVERGYRPGMEVLNKSALVLLCAIWEAYCEDIADEALRHLVANSRDFSTLPKALRKNVAKELKDDPHELAVWKLAGDGWKSHLHGRLAALKRRRDFDWNNPRSANVTKFFEEAIGIPAVTDAWHWKHISPATASKMLDTLVALRGAIAHRGKAAESVTIYDVVRYLTHINRLVETTDGKVRDDLASIAGTRPWG
jgi:hypothetical protein